VSLCAYFASRFLAQKDLHRLPCDRTNEGNARTATYEAIATLAATAVPDQLNFVSQAGLAILSRSEKLLEMRVSEQR
jgi:hypothetical protein